MTYRPEQWKSARPIPILINFPGLGTVAPYVQNSSITAILPQNQTFYAFDAVMELSHEQDLELTRHPVQSGASISDHAYIMPARLTIDVGMSDAMDSFEQPDTWSGSTSKSVSTYQTMLALQQSRIPLVLTTKLRTYNNMVVRSVNPRDTAKTYAGLRMSVLFEQIIIASITILAVSARPQDTNSTLLGTITPLPPSPAIISQNGISGLIDPAIPSNAIGAGNWSSVNNTNLSSLPGPK